MFKIWNAFRTKLAWYLIGCVAISGILAIGVGYLIVYFGLDFIETRFDDPEVNKMLQTKYVERLQEYVEENQVSANNIAEVKNWTDDNDYVYLSIYQNNKVIFNSNYAYYDSDIDAVEEDEEDGVLLDERNLYRLNLADGTIASVDMFCYDYWQYYYYVWGLGVGVGILIFIGLLTRLLQHKLSYINDIEKELQILEGGNLEYQITIKGNDELANLARDIDQMRLSIVENLKKEQQTLQANKDLVTSMSHDLRTPLTTLTGYLEILNMEHVKDEEKRKHYMELSLAKAQEIKNLSDELFEYFLVYGQEHNRIDMEAVPAFMLVSDLIENQFLGLEEEGYQITSRGNVDESNGNCMINSRYMQRVLNNIISNLMKYADKGQPIEVLAEQREHFLDLSVRNGIRKNLDVHESTRIGLITCERIMDMQGGKFQKIETEEHFTVKLIIPME